MRVDPGMADCAHAKVRSIAVAWDAFDREGGAVVAYRSGNVFSRFRQNSGTSRRIIVHMKLREFQAVLRADLACNQEPLSKLTVLTFRLGQYAFRGRHPLLRAAWRAWSLWYVNLLIGAEIPPAIECGPGLALRHGGRGVILHPAARIGSRATIYHRVTIGQRGPGVPVIGDGVYIGTGASILGDLAVGNGARIGAGAVVIRDVPPGRTAVGVPAKLLSEVDHLGSLGHITDTAPRG